MQNEGREAGDKDLSKEVIFEEKMQGNESKGLRASWKRAHQAWKNGEKRPRGRSRLSKGRGGADGQGADRWRRKSGPALSVLRSRWEFSAG